MAFQHGVEGYIRLVSRQKTELVLLSSEPINEPHIKYGSFVMNHENEILHAMRDAQIGKMGILIEDFD
jgi:redox-sensitive bicupin YhaK (pirin superfamily)